MYTRHFRVTLKDLQEGLKNGQTALDIAIDSGLEEVDDEMAVEHMCGYDVSAPFTSTDSDRSAEWAIGEELEKTIADLKAVKIDRSAENNIPEEYREDLDDEFGEGWQFDAIEEYIQDMINIALPPCKRAKQLLWL